LPEGIIGAVKEWREAYCSRSSGRQQRRAGRKVLKESGLLNIIGSNQSDRTLPSKFVKAAEGK